MAWFFGVKRRMENTHTAPRDAASLMVLRSDGGNHEILMGRRSAGHRFMPGILVFPGGAVDPADFVAPIGTGLRPEVQARLARSAGPELARALGVAAARELAEEVGLSMGTPPHLDRLHYLCRAITPPDRRIRFDARFFVIDAAYVTGTPSFSAELEQPEWHKIDHALQAQLVQPTRSILGQLRSWLAIGRPALAGDAPIPVLRDRVWKTE